MYLHRLLPLASLALVIGAAEALGDLPGQTATRTAVGKITQIKPAERQLTLETRAGKAITFTLDRNSSLRHANRPATLDQFREGSRVRVTYDPKSPTNRVVAMDSAAATAEDLQREVNEALKAAKDYSFQRKDEYRERLQRLADQMEDRLAELQERARDATGDARVQLERSIQDLRGREKVLRQRMERVGSASADAWDDIRAGVGSALEDLHGAYQRAVSRFR